MRSLIKMARERVGSFWVPAAMLLTFLTSGVHSFATDAVFDNEGVITEPPRIDATTVINSGIMDFSTAIPFTTSSTLNFSNLVSFPGAGVITETPGWIFDFEPVNLGYARMSANFFNANLGVIEAVDPGIPFVIENGIAPPQAAIVGASKLFVTATNIVNHGRLTVGANGWLRLLGHNVDLSRSVLNVLSVSGGDEASGSYNNAPFDGYFVPDIAISDLYWGTTNLDFDSAVLWDGLLATVPQHGVTFPVGGTSTSSTNSGTVAFSFVPSAADTYLHFDTMEVTVTNSDGTLGTDILITNIIKQAVFVGAPSGFTAQIGFTPSPNPNNPFNTASVLLTAQVTNRIDNSVQTSRIYFQDQLASTDGRGLLQNIITPNAYRPTNYLVSRVNQGLGSPGVGLPSPTFFLDSGNLDFATGQVGIDTVTNSHVSGVYDAYSPFIDNIVSEPVGAFSTGLVTNLPGRVHIYADNLDLTKTRIRAEGEVIINTPHLISSSEAVIDCQNLSFNLGTTNGDLRVQNLSGDAVGRVFGHMYAWSALWSNTVMVIVTNNYIVDTNGTVTGISPITNMVGVSYYTLMLDGEQLQDTAPVNVFDFITHGTNLVVDDNLKVVQSFIMDAQNFTLNGNMSLSSVTLENTYGPSVTVAVPNWVSTNAPNLLFFTNNGSLSVLNEAHFGDDRAFPYSSLVNFGAISAQGIQLASDYFDNSGSISAAGPSTFAGGNGRLENGASSSGGVSWFRFGTLKFDNYQLTANGTAYFVVTNALFDSGGSSGNVFKFEDGFNLLVKPATGDLLGTTFQSIALNLVSPSIEVDHYWAGEDRGPNAAGFVNNEAIGKLVLTPFSTDPLFYFSGTGVQNGLYVDLLDLSQLTDYTNQLRINSNLVIYYAAVKLAFTPPNDRNGVAQLPEEFLDGQFGGRLRWVPCFAGPNSSADVIINGQTYQVNAALRNSMRIDSNNNGIPNGVDPFPFNALPCSSAALAAQTGLSIQSPVQGQLLLQPTAQVQGVASSSSGQAWVYYQLNSGNWTPAASADGGATWSANVMLQPGTNVVQAYATDAAGHQSAINKVGVWYSPSAPLALQVNGGGTVAPITNGQWLALNQTYTITAYPQSGYTFSGWSGTYSSPANQLTFLMRSNVTLAANFAAQPFTPATASYNGLFYESNGVEFGKSGAFTATTTPKGAYSGNLQLGATRYPFNGKLNSFGSAFNTIPLKTGGHLDLSWQVDAGGNTVTGTLSNNTWVAEVHAVRARQGMFTGKYTLVIPGNGNNTNTPQGDGYATVTVSRSGKVQLNGVLADGTKVTDSSAVSENGDWPLYAPLYQGQGQVLGWLSFTNAAEADLEGWINWARPALPTAGYYPAGFVADITNVVGSAYNPAATPVTGFTNASVVLTGGNLQYSLTNEVTIGANNKVTSSNKKLSLTFVPGQGLFKGSIADPAAPATLKFGGVILQKQSAASGSFLGTNQSGKVLIAP